MKARRQAVILQLLDRDAIHNQEQLRLGLERLGIPATQATISRDIKELGLVKRAVDGAYQRPNAPPPPVPAGANGCMRVIGDWVTEVTRVQQLVVLKTPPGQANPTALAIDHAQMPGIVGTIAGDDTILVILRDPRRASEFEGRVRAATGQARIR
jgi:transcriptional regulator of arginine metabolism